MDVYDRNPGETIDGECAIVVSGDRVVMIEMDDGEVFGLSDADAEPRSWREYVLSRVITRWTDASNYVKAISFNRNRFEIRRRTDDDM